jgi:hypothetical protein
VTAEVVECVPQGTAGEYTCTLQVSFEGPLEINTVWRVALTSAALPTTGAPQVSSAQGCTFLPNPSPYYLGSYYDINISTDGCQTGAIITITESVTGTAGVSTNHSVSGISGTSMGTAQANYTLPAEPAGTPTPTTGAASPTPAAAAAGAASPTPTASTTPTASPTPVRTATATLPAGPTATHTPAATATRPAESTATRPSATATPASAGPPRASDGQHLGLQPAEVQTAFTATHGANAAQRWADEHDAELARTTL